MANFKIECTNDGVKDGKLLFTKGKTYEVSEQGTKWKTVNDAGETQTIDMDKLENRLFFSDYFKKV